MADGMAASIALVKNIYERSEGDAQVAMTISPAVPAPSNPESLQSIQAQVQPGAALY